jgi:hypothetical protein
MVRDKDQLAIRNVEDTYLYLFALFFWYNFRANFNVITSNLKEQKNNKIFPDRRTIYFLRPSYRNISECHQGY